MRVYSRTLPVRSVVSLIDRKPQSSRAVDEPFISIWAKFWLSLPTGERSNPVDLECKVQVLSDKTFKVVEIKPKFGFVRGLVSNSIFDIYRDTLIQAINDTDLAILGVGE